MNQVDWDRADGGSSRSQSPRAERRRGRPTKRAAERLSHTILEIAFRQFLEAGYAATSMDSVAAEAGTSKRTLYDRFSSKQRLFEAALQHHVLFDYEALQVFEAQPDPLDVLLPKIAAWLRTNMFAPRSLALFRLLAAEGHRHPELAGYSEDRLLRPVLDMLTGVFARASDRGEVREMPPEFLANQFLQGVCGGDIRACIYGSDEVEHPEEMARRMADVVGLFLRGAGRRT